MKAYLPRKGIRHEGGTWEYSKAAPKYKVDTTSKSKGTGVQKSGYQLPPVKLPGMTPEKKKMWAEKAETVLKQVNMRVEMEQRNPAQNPEATYQRNQNLLKGITSVVGPAVLDEVAELVPGRRRDISGAVRDLASYASFIPGLGPYAYAFSAFGGPILDIIIATAEAAAKNNVVPGAMTAPAGLEEYATFLKENPDADLTFEEYKEYMKQMQEYEQRMAGKSCQKITSDMLGGMTLEEYAAENGIEITDEPEETPPAYKKKDPNKFREPTKEEREALAGPFYPAI